MRATPSVPSFSTTGISADAPLCNPRLFGCAGIIRDAARAALYQLQLSG